jgi:putative ABC transport system permease protein
MREFFGDLRLAARSLVREPGLALTAALMLGLGLGAATAVFSLVNGALLNPLTYRDPGRLVAIREVIPEVARLYPSLPVSARHFVEWRKACPSIDGIALIDTVSVNLTGSGEPERLDAARVSPNLFRVLGVRPAMGRDFQDDEEQDGHDQVVVLGDGLWRRRFQADQALLGRRIVLNGRPHLVIGILPPSFRFPNLDILDAGHSAAPRADLFTPKVFSKNEMEELLGMFNFGAIARLKPRVSTARAATELEAVQARMETLAGEKVGMKALVMPLLDAEVGQARRGLYVLMAAVGVVLLTICVNLANLLLARAERRGREIAVRAALGAGRARLIGHAMAETALIAIAGGLLGFGVAAAGIYLLTHRAPVEIPRLDEVRLDGRVLAFAGLMAAFTATLFGFLPAWRATRGDLQLALRSGARGAGGSRASSRLRSTLVACEVGLSGLLLILAGLLTNSFMRLMRADKGFRAPTALAVDIGLAGDAYKEDAQRDGFYKRLLADLASEPGVQSAGISSALPLQGETWVDSASTTPITGLRTTGAVMVNVRFVSADYFRTLGISLPAGRTFNENDRRRKVAIIAANLAAALWPGQDPLGRKFTTGGDQWLEVIGVAGDVRVEAHRTPVAMMYQPYWDWMPYRTVLVARAAGDPRSIAGAIRSAIHRADPDVPVPRMRTMADVLDESVATRRFQMALAAGFAAVALLVAGLGIFAVVSYSVARRTSELGIRAALGATEAGLYKLVLGQGMAPVAAGLLAAVAVALVLGRLIESMLYEIGGRDPLTIAVVALAIMLVALAACLIPARRAARVDPATALRYE